MPRSLSLRSALAAITMAVVALCGGGKSLAAPKGTPSIVEVRGAPAVRETKRTSTEQADALSQVEIVVATSAEDAGSVETDRPVLVRASAATVPVSLGEVIAVPPQTSGEEKRLLPQPRAPPLSVQT